jgi:hypothetical protein
VLANHTQGRQQDHRYYSLARPRRTGSRAFSRVPFTLKILLEEPSAQRGLAAQSREDLRRSRSGSRPRPRTGSRVSPARC